MPTKSITVTIASIGSSAGPFNISDNVLGVVAMNVSRSQLLAGYSVNVDTTATVVTVTSIGACTTSLTLNLATPTPTPTPTATPTPTVTPTPTQNPIYFDSNFTNTANVCGGNPSNTGGKIWSRLVAPAGTTVEITVKAEQFITSVNSVSASISGILYNTTLPSANPPKGTIVTSSYASILYTDVPNYISDTEVATVTIPAEGYQDYLLIYNTNNIASNFTNGEVRATITKVNGVSVDNGGSLATSYNCSNTTYYEYMISPLGYTMCGDGCNATVSVTDSVYATVLSETLLVGQYLYTSAGGPIWGGGTGNYHRITKVGNMGNGYSAVVSPLGRVVSVTACALVSPGTCA